MKFKLLLLATTLLSASAIANVDCSALKNKTYNSVITKVDDGDTATVKINKLSKTVSVRFYGVDTPESEWKDKWPEQHFSSEAKNFTIKSLYNKSVTVKFDGNGTYGRCVGEILVNNKSHSLALIEGGYAWWYERYSSNRTDFKVAQSKAKKSKRGLWAKQNPIAPWNYRRNF
jgi:endonuclease YncB( thermonuclease family)